MNKILELINRYREIIVYLIVGFATFLVCFLSYTALVVTVCNPENPILLQVANIISSAIGIAFAYVTNRKFVFQSKEPNIKKECGQFVTSRIGTVLIEMGVMAVTVSILGLNDKICKICAQVLTTVLNYIFSKFLVFAKKEKK